MARRTGNERFLKGGDSEITIGDLPGGSGAGSGAAIPDLTHSALTGTQNDVMEDIATADAALESDLKELSVKINTILAALRTAGVIST